MYCQSSQFQLPTELAPAAIIERLSSEWPLGEPDEERFSCTYYDSFDWRLFIGGAELKVRRQGRVRELEWIELAGGTPVDRLTVKGEMPQFCWEFPPGSMRSRVEALLEMRSLQPQVEVQSTVKTFSVIDDEAKTVARLVVQQHAARTPGKGEFAEMPHRIVLLPIRGYDDSFERLNIFLQQEFSLEQGGSTLLPAALAAIGREAADYSSKLDFQFKPGQAAVVATRQIHLHLLDTLERNLEGTKANLDSEFLHDLRVAVRRTRSALTQIKGVFPAYEVERFKPDLAWIGQITGESRDMDVYLLDFGRYRATLPERFRSDIDPLKKFLLAHQKSAYRRMVRQLNSDKFQELLSDWRAFLQQETVDSVAAPAALTPVAQVADRRIYRIYKRVLAEGGAIGDETPAEALHDLRKSCKKLRYLIEFFQSLYPRRKVRPLIKSLKVLLDNLGSFQDLEVQAEKLRQFAHQMVEEGEVPADTLLAMGMLVDGLLRRQTEVRREFGSRFAEFAGSENRIAFKSLFAKGARAA